MMEFRIADTFTDSLAKLTGEEQKAVKTTAFDLQRNPSNPGLRLCYTGFVYSCIRVFVYSC
jgi:hypothetical protein